MLVPANRYPIPTMPGFRIVVDFGGASLERFRAGEWVIEASAVSLDELFWSEKLDGIERADLVAEDSRR